MRKTIIAAVILLLAIEPAISASFFSLFGPHRRAVHHRQRGPVEPEQIPDCRQIREAVRTLTPANLERALRAATKRQREIIDKCALGGD